MKKIRKKKCVVCGESFTPFNTTTQRSCSVTCAIKHAKLKEANKKSGLNEIRNEKFSIESLSKLMKSTEVMVHEYIRLRDKGKPCISCDQKWSSQFQAGHFMNKKQYSMIRFKVDNIHGQCKKCNLFMEGNYNEYQIRLPKRIGEERYQKLVKRAEIASKIPYKWSRSELKEIQKQTRILINELKTKNK